MTPNHPGVRLEALENLKITGRKVHMSTVTRLCSFIVLSASVIIPTSSGAIAATAPTVLDRARQAVGGAARLAAVKSLVVEGSTTRDLWRRASPPAGAVVFPSPETEPYGFRLLMPDRYQNTGTEVRHTLDGQNFWMREDVYPDLIVRDDIRATARRSTLTRFKEACLCFLLRWPSLYPLEVRAAGRTRIAGRDGEAIQFTGPQGNAGRMLFDATTHVPILFAATTVSDTGDTSDRFVFLEDYRMIGQLRFPFRIVEQYGDRMRLTTVLTTVKVNAPLTPTDFKKPGR